MCDIPAIGTATPKIMVEFTLDEARQLRQLLKSARAFAWKLKDAIKEREAQEERTRQETCEKYWP